MAQFQGIVKGQRGQETRLGSKVSGLDVAANGWNAGVRVRASHRDGKDVFLVYATSGSNAELPETLIATVIECPGTFGQVDVEHFYVEVKA